MKWPGAEPSRLLRLCKQEAVRSLHGDGRRLERRVRGGLNRPQARYILVQTLRLGNGFSHASTMPEGHAQKLQTLFGHSALLRHA
jgi:hypothetical protein